MALEVDSLEKLIELINGRQAKFLTIDGRNGSGKSTLANHLHKKMGGTLMSEENFRDTDLIYQFLPPYEKISAALRESIPKGPVIYESVLMQWILENIQAKPDLTIYVKRMSPMGLWGDESELDDGMTRQGATDQIPTKETFNFRRQMINYHFDYMPHEKSAVIFLRTER